jgi:PAS domain S-box-containing protein
VAGLSDAGKTKEQLLRELLALRSQVAAKADAEEEASRLSLFVEQTPASMAMFDGSMRYLAVSRQWLVEYGLEGQDLIGRNHYDVFPGISERWNETHRRCLAGVTERSEEEPFQCNNGKVERLRWEICPWRDRDGSIGGIMIFSEVVTARKETEEKLRTARKALELSIEEQTAETARLVAGVRSAAESIIITDPSCCLEYVNPAFTFSPIIRPHRPSARP